MFVYVKKDGKTIACYRKDYIVNVGYDKGICTLNLLSDIQHIYTITGQDFSDLVSQLKQDQRLLAMVISAREIASNDLFIFCNSNRIKAELSIFTPRL